jgi:hypothetical protein
MRGFIFLITFFSYSLLKSQPAVFYDFQLEDFETQIISMVSTQDAMYLLTDITRTDSSGALLEMNNDGQIVKVIHEFGEDELPHSLVGNNEYLFGTTRGSGKFFRYNIKDDIYSALRVFDPDESQEAKLVTLTDSVIWGVSFRSSVDEGSIFKLDLDGSSFTKVFNETNENNGQNPVDIHFSDTNIFVSFFNGGGIPYDDGAGGAIFSGSVARLTVDGQDFTRIFEGQDGIGTQPRSLEVVNNDLYIWYR